MQKDVKISIYKNIYEFKERCCQDFFLICFVEW